MRAPEVPELMGEDLKLFQGIIEPNDIKQGQLGDCYFLSSLAALAEIPVRIERIFLQKERHQTGAYGLAMCKNGVRQAVLVDNHIPVKNKELVYSRANGKETWVLILEKAWAKLHG